MNRACSQVKRAEGKKEITEQRKGRAESKIANDLIKMIVPDDEYPGRVRAATLWVLS